MEIVIIHKWGQLYPINLNHITPCDERPTGFDDSESVEIEQPGETE